MHTLWIPVHDPYHKVLHDHYYMVKGVYKHITEDNSDEDSSNEDSKNNTNEDKINFYENPEYEGEKSEKVGSGSVWDIDKTVDVNKCHASVDTDLYIDNKNEVMANHDAGEILEQLNSQSFGRFSIECSQSACFSPETSNQPIDLSIKRRVSRPNTDSEDSIPMPQPIDFSLKPPRHPDDDDDDDDNKDADDPTCTVHRFPADLDDIISLSRDDQPGCSYDRQPRNPGGGEALEGLPWDIPLDIDHNDLIEGLLELDGQANVSQESEPPGNSTIPLCVEMVEQDVNTAEEDNKRRLCEGGKIKGNLCDFLLETLENPVWNPSLVRWEGENTFRILDGEKLAQLWASNRNRKLSSFSNLTRAIRHYYHKDMIGRAKGKNRYTFGTKARRHYEMWKEARDREDEDDEFL